MQALEDVKDTSREEIRDLLDSLDGMCRVWGHIKRLREAFEKELGHCGESLGSF